jgi:hypothetical protein
MNELFLGVLAAVALGLAVTGVARHVVHKRHERLRAQGYELIFSLKSYSAWVDCQSDEPFVSRDSDELASPEPLARAVEIRKAAFPGLSQHMLRLLQAHSRLVEYLWQQNLLRQSQAAGWRPAWQDPRYQQIRGAQEDLIQEMIGLCQEMIGDRAEEWRQTGTDFAFSSSMSTTRGRAAGA